QTAFHFSITNSDWEDNVRFEELVKNCKEVGYFEAGGKKWTCPFHPVSINKQECESLKGSLSISSCNYNNDYWAGAAKQCGGTNKMPTLADLANIASVLYSGNPVIGPTKDVDGLTYVPDTASSLGLPEPSFLIWAADNNTQYNASSRGFYSSYTKYIYSSRNGSGMWGICAVN
ncbi:TPA: hypothetical protein IAC10_14045, partial [Candidatus Scatousia excrementigallinarum]|nr:hypothetical protein [Candidatus Scatousia excrementigallinarum]